MSSTKAITLITMKEMVITTEITGITIIKAMTTEDMIIGMITTIDEGDFKGAVDILKIKRNDHIDPFSVTHVLH